MMHFNVNRMHDKKIILFLCFKFFRIISSIDLWYYTVHLICECINLNECKSSHCVASTNVFENRNEEVCVFWFMSHNSKNCSITSKKRNKSTDETPNAEQRPCDFMLLSKQSLSERSPMYHTCKEHKHSQKREFSEANKKCSEFIGLKEIEDIKKKVEKEELSNLVLIRNHSTIYPTLIKIQRKLNALTLNGRISSFCCLLTLLLVLLLLLSMFLWRLPHVNRKSLQSLFCHCFFFKGFASHLTFALSIIWISAIPFIGPAFVFVCM